MSSHRPTSLTWVTVFLVVGCSGGAAGETDGEEETGAAEALRPNWHEDVAPLVAENCAGCHVDGGIAPLSLTSYDEAKEWGPQMVVQTQARTMPPWHAEDTDECTPQAPWLHDARLSDDQIGLIADWVDAGMPEGDPANAADLPQPPSLDLPGATDTVRMQGSISVSTDQAADDFHCLSLDPGLTSEAYLTGFQMLPGNSEILHHVLVYIDDQGTSAGTYPSDGVRLDCGGGTGGIANARLVGGWVPGAMPTEFPEGVGVTLPAGSRLVLNMHYHATGSAPQTDDSSGLALRLSSTPTEWNAQFELIGNMTAPVAGGEGLETPPFQIPAGASGHEETMIWTVPQNVPDELRVFEVANHMHIVGTDMLTRIIPASGDDPWCLAHTPRWDFNWQRIYAYDRPIDQAPRVFGGDQVHLRCRYDNTISNPALAGALLDLGLEEPVDVGLGEGTLDEMCLAAVGIAYRG